MIFITLMLPVEVRIFPTVEVIANLKMLDSYAGLTLPLMASGDRHVSVSPVLYDPTG